MLSDEILVVEKVEYHLWKTCPCQACRLERKGREPSGSFTPIKRLSVSAASLFGYLPCRNPHGSLARQLMKEAERA